jgi:hypothetical protein
MGFKINCYEVYDEPIPASCGIVCVVSDALTCTGNWRCIGGVWWWKWRLHFRWRRRGGEP